MYLEVGNAHAVDGYRDADDVLRFVPLEGEHVTRVEFPEDWGIQDCFAASLAAIKRNMADGGVPAWVESDNEGLRTLLVQHYHLNKRATRPEGWGDLDRVVVAKDTETGESKPVAKRATRKKKPPAAVEAQMALVFALLLFMATRLALRTNAGRDWQARIMGDPSANGAGTYASGSWMGLTADTATPNAGSTSLSGEITTGTLARKQCAYSHTNGTQTYSLTAVFTSDQSVIVAKLGIFNLATAGTLIFETLLNSPSQMRAGDVTAVTETVTL